MSEPVAKFHRSEASGSDAGNRVTFLRSQGIDVGVDVLRRRPDVVFTLRTSRNWDALIDALTEAMTWVNPAGVEGSDLTDLTELAVQLQKLAPMYESRGEYRLANPNRIEDTFFSRCEPDAAPVPDFYKLPCDTRASVVEQKIRPWLKFMGYTDQNDLPVLRETSPHAIYSAMRALVNAGRGPESTEAHDATLRWFVNYLSAIPVTNPTTILDLGFAVDKDAFKVRIVLDGAASAITALKTRRVPISVRSVALSAHIVKLLAAEPSNGEPIVYVNGDSGSGKTEGMIGAAGQFSDPAVEGLAWYIVDEGFRKTLNELASGTANEQLRSDMQAIADSQHFAKRPPSAGGSEVEAFYHQMSAYVVQRFDGLVHAAPTSPVRVLLIFDEMGEYPAVCRALCHQRAIIQKHVAQSLQVKRVSIVVGGTGVDGVDSRFGSTPNSFNMVDANQFSRGVWRALGDVNNHHFQQFKEMIDHGRHPESKLTNAVVHNARIAALIHKFFVMTQGEHNCFFLTPATAEALATFALQQYKFLNGSKDLSPQDFCDYLLTAAAVSQYGGDASWHTQMRVANDSLIDVLRFRHGMIADKALTNKQAADSTPGTVYEIDTTDVWLPCGVAIRQRYGISNAQLAILHLVVCKSVVKSGSSGSFEEACLEMTILHVMMARRHADQILLANLQPAFPTVHTASRGEWITPEAFLRTVAGWVGSTESGQLTWVYCRLQHHTAAVSAFETLVTDPRDPTKKLTVQEVMSLNASSAAAKYAVAYLSANQAPCQDWGLLVPRQGNRPPLHIKGQSKCYANTPFANTSLATECAKMGLDSFKARVSRWLHELAGPNRFAFADKLLVAVDAASHPTHAEVAKRVKDQVAAAATPNGARQSLMRADIEQAVYAICGLDATLKIKCDGVMKPAISPFKVASGEEVKYVFVVYGVQPQTVVSSILDEITDAGEEITLVYAAKDCRDSPNLWPIRFTEEMPSWIDASAAAAPVVVGASVP